MREEWAQPDALIVSDCLAVTSQYTHNHLASNCTVAAANSIRAGCDLNTGRPYFQNGCLNDSLQTGMVSINTIETSLRRSLLWRFKLGLFDDPGVQPLATLGIPAINTSKAQQLVQEAAAQGLVLLRNDGVLPLRAGMPVAVVGCSSCISDSPSGPA